MRNPVANWNAVLGGENDPPHSKRGSLVGMTSRNGVLFACMPSRNEDELVPGGGQGLVTQWNGLAAFDGTAAPATAFDPDMGSGQGLAPRGSPRKACGLPLPTHHVHTESTSTQVSEELGRVMVLVEDQQ